MSKKLKELKEWATENVTLVKLLPPNDNLQVTTRLIDVLEDEVDEKYYLSEEKTKKLTLDHDLGGKLNMYNYNERDIVHSVNKVAPTLNTMQGGNRQPKIAIKQIGNIVDNKETFGGNPQRGRVYNSEGLSPALNCMRGGGLEPKVAVLGNTSNTGHKSQVAQTLQAGEVNQGVVMNDIRIRKLSPLECWRLQGFTDEQFYKAKDSGVSNSQLYKQAGNSVSVPVVDAIVKQLKE